MITAQECAAIEAREFALAQWLGKRASYHPDELPRDILPPTNDERAQVELFRFMRDKPARYFAYWTDSGITNWTGIVLARITWEGRPYHVYGFGHRSTRRNFRAVGVNGVSYSGTYYESSGQYVRMRAVKGGAA